MKRIFIGIPVSEEIKRKIKPLIDKLEETGAELKSVPLENLHLTLKFLGDVEEDKIEEIKEKLYSLKGKEFNLSVNKVGVFPSLEKINVIWIGAENIEIVSLMKEMDQRLNYIKENDHPDNVPHLTIARVKSGRNIERLKTVLKEAAQEDFGEMFIDKFILYESQLTQKGPVYTEVKEFRLE